MVTSYNKGDMVSIVKFAIEWQTKGMLEKDGEPLLTTNQLFYCWQRWRELAGVEAVLTLHNKERGIKIQIEDRCTITRFEECRNTRTAFEVDDMKIMPWNDDSWHYQCFDLSSNHVFFDSHTITKTV